MLPRWSVPLLLAALVAGLLPTPAAARGAEVGWEYVVDASDPASGKLRVAIHITGARGDVTVMCFDTRGHEYPVDVQPAPGVDLDTSCKGDAVDGVHRLTVDEDFETFRYTVDVRKTAPGKADEYASWLDADGGVVKAESMALRYEYSYYCAVQKTPCPPDESPRFRTTVKFLLPPRWSVEGPWPRAAPATFDLPAGETLPRGFLAFGEFVVEKRQSEGREFRYAQLGAAPEEYSRDDLFRYLAAASPWYEGVYGPEVGSVVLVVSHGAPMFTGGLGGHDSLYVHDDADLRTLAHEYAHVWQQFSGSSSPGDATVWMNEGDAELHGTLSLFVTGEWTLDRVNDFFEEADAARSKTRERLVDGVYGHEDAIAYKKGLVTLLFLDDAIRRNTDGAKALPDLLRALNAMFHDPPNGPRRVDPLTNDEVLKKLNEVTGRDFAEAWDRYVYGVDWPPFVPVRAQEDLVVTAVEFTPETATPGDRVVARVVAENRGLTDVRKEVAVTLAGEEIGAVTFDIPVAARAGDATIEFTAPEPGTHTFKVGPLETTYVSLAPARVALDRVSVLPSKPRAGEPASVLVYVENSGGAAGPARVRLLVGGVAVGDQALTVPGNGTATATFDVTFDEPGPVVIAAALSGENPDRETLTIDVRPADRDGDGVPDAEDAYPDNPALTEPGAVNQLRNQAGGGAALVALAALALVAMRRRS